MNETIDRVLLSIGKYYESDIQPDSRYYLEVNIGKKADQLGITGVSERYREVNAIVPLREPNGSMRVRIDGRTFVNYVQFDSGVAIPGYAAKESNNPYKAYIPQNSMILGFG